MKNKLLILLAAVLTTSCATTPKTDAEIDEYYRKLKISNEQWKAKEAQKTQKQRFFEESQRRAYRYSSPYNDYRTRMHVIDALYGY